MCCLLLYDEESLMMIGALSRRQKGETDTQKNSSLGDQSERKALEKEATPKNLLRLSLALFKVLEKAK